MIIFETKRIIVRRWEFTDCLDLYEYDNIDDAKYRIATLMGNYKTRNLLDRQDYAIVLKENGKVIGGLNLNRTDDKVGGILVIGYALNEKYHGYGYMTETLKGLFKFVKDNSLACRIEAVHDVENVKSGAVMKRAGMTFEGIRRKSGNNNYHTRYDNAVYSILIEEIE